MEHAPARPVRIDPNRMEQVLGNLLSNAIRYTPQGGWIKISCQCTRTTAAITIHDSGPGIPEEAIPHLFDRFYRADKSRARSEGGTGLGLSIAKRLVEAHQGKITASNHPDGGGLFTILLPVEDVDEQSE